MSESSTPSAKVTWRDQEFNCPTDEEISMKVSEIMNSLSTQVKETLTISITGKDLPNFELIDLPGLVAVSKGNGSKEAIMELVKEFIDEDTLILCVVPATLLLRK